MMRGVEFLYTAAQLGTKRTSIVSFFWIISLSFI